MDSVNPKSVRGVLQVMLKTSHALSDGAKCLTISAVV